MTPGAPELRPRRSQEVRGSQELHNGGLRALEKAWMTTFRLRHSCPVWSFSVSLWARAGLAEEDEEVEEEEEKERRRRKRVSGWPG